MTFVHNYIYIFVYNFLRDFTNILDLTNFCLEMIVDRRNLFINVVWKDFKSFTLPDPIKSFKTLLLAWRNRKVDYELRLPHYESFTLSVDHGFTCLIILPPKFLTAELQQLLDIKISMLRFVNRLGMGKEF